MSTTREDVRDKYAAAARVAATGASCCSDAGCGAGVYQIAEPVPEQALAASLGCGNPVAVADLTAGDVVLDLGSGAGLDLVLSARRVGPSGVVYGLDMTDEMLALARETIAAAGVANVHLLRGYIEAVPLPADTVDVVISNCVVNLSLDKAAVFAEIRRVLKPGGRMGISDILADDGLSPEVRAERGSWAGCIAGALTFAEYRAGLEAAGLVDVEIVRSHEVVEGMYSAIVRARKGD